MKLSHVLMFALFSTLAACAGDVVDEEYVDSQFDSVIAETNGRWPNRKNIPVCFVNGDGNSAMERGTRSVIESEYAKVGLCFSGWGRCDASTPCPAIRIAYGPKTNENAGTAGWSFVGNMSWRCGNHPDRQKESMWLRDDQWDWAAVHEFGHAIGLQHEHARTDHNGRCAASQNEQIADDNDTDYLTPYDDMSAMCYCSGRSRLSTLDIQGIKTFYNVGSDLSCGGQPEQGFRLQWAFAGPIGGMTCTQITEPADPNTWHDNFICADRDLGLRWSYAGPIAGMVCTHIHEGSDPHGWNDNYLCAPRDLGLRYSSAGPIAGMNCTQLVEGADPHTWNDNYLCKP